MKYNQSLIQTAMKDEERDRRKISQRKVAEEQKQTMSSKTMASQKGKKKQTAPVPEPDPQMPSASASSSQKNASSSSKTSKPADPEKAEGSKYVYSKLTATKTAFTVKSTLSSKLCRKFEKKDWAQTHASTIASTFQDHVEMFMAEILSASRLDSLRTLLGDHGIEAPGGRQSKACLQDCFEEVGRQFDSISFGRYTHNGCNTEQSATNLNIYIYICK